jgi:hypothetical protein
LATLPDEGGPSPRRPPLLQAASNRLDAISSGKLARIAIHPRGNFLSQLMRGERIHGTAIVFRDNEEIVETDPVLGAAIAFIGQ